MTKLEEIGNAQRNKLAPRNVYNSSDNAKNYSATHPNAIAHDHGSDDPRDLKGKGTGVFLDTNPNNATGAGGYQDIFGNDTDISSGRINNIKVNVYNSSDNAKNYSATHPNAKAHDHGSDDPRDLKGKGTGIYLDTNPDSATGAGGYYDIFGITSDISSGRINNLKFNKYKNGASTEYTQPIIGSNVNQYTNPG